MVLSPKLGSVSVPLMSPIGSSSPWGQGWHVPIGLGLCAIKGDSITLGGIWPTLECVCVCGGLLLLKYLVWGDRINTYTEWVLIVRREKDGHRCSVSRQNQLLQW